MHMMVEHSDTAAQPKPHTFGRWHPRLARAIWLDTIISNLLPTGTNPIIPLSPNPTSPSAQHSILLKIIVSYHFVLFQAPPKQFSTSINCAPVRIEIITPQNYVL